MPLLTSWRQAVYWPHRLPILRFILGCVIVLCSGRLTAQTETPKEFQVKAVFLFNFSHFVDWPTNTFTNTQSPFVIGVLGQDPFGNYLEETVRGEKVDDHPLVVKHFQNISEVKDCQILFISRSEERKLREIFAELKGTDVLTVSDAKNFSGNGGMIGFVTTPQNKIHFQINLNATKDARLVVSSKLLRLAEIVGEQKGTPL